MCSIYGAIGEWIDPTTFEEIRELARDRGRDGGRYESYTVGHFYSAVLGNWRATPTPEPEVGLLQPYDKMVHNGTIANDAELGALPGEIDSQTLARIIDRSSVQALADSLQKVKGSYALACFNGATVLAATNYKPLYYCRIGPTIYFSSMARHLDTVVGFGRAPVALPPYTAIDFITREQVSLHTDRSKRAVIIASAGLDSTVAATKLVREGWDVCLLHFTYGCAAGDKEYCAIPMIADALGCRSAFVNVDLAQMLGLQASTLFDKRPDAKIAGAIEGAEYAHEWVPGRNLVFISLAVAWAEAHGYHTVALGNNLEEAGAYPDNEEEFTHLLNKAVPYAVQAHYGMGVVSPVGNLMKHEIVKLGLELGAPFEWTWSCYRGGRKHCGECGPCFMRRKAFERSGGIDPVFA